MPEVGSEQRPSTADVESPAKTPRPTRAAVVAGAALSAAGGDPIDYVGRKRLAPPELGRSLARAVWQRADSGHSELGFDVKPTRAEAMVARQHAPAASSPSSAEAADEDISFAPLVKAGLEAEDMARLRDMYNEGARQIAVEARAMEAAAGGDAAKLREIADWAVKARNELKAKIRDQGARIVKAIAEARNVKKYGNPLGPSAERLRAKGLSDAEIVASAQRSNPGVTRWAGRLRVAGRIMIAIDIGIAAYRIYHADTDRPRVIGEEVGGIAGGLGGAWLGAKALGAGGALIGGPIGAGIGAVLGGIGGAIAGAWAGSNAGGWLATQLYPPSLTAFEGAFSTR